MTDKPIYVTQPYLPPLEEFSAYLERIWENKILTNSGPYHQQLEDALCSYLGVQYISLFSNATVALITALKALNIQGEVITTPYSFVATAHSLQWNGIAPIFVDIDPRTFNMDPSKIEVSITDKTTAIMPVHCYGNPCDVEAIQEIADKYKLKVIYDAAHAFGVNCDCGSILNHGDLSVLSFHATKVFNTFEGGAIVSSDAKMKRHIDQLKNFGIVDEVTVDALGINGKMSEINAAFGLLQLKYIDSALSSRGEIDGLYRKLLKGVKGITALESKAVKTANYSYFPVIVGSDYPLTRDMLYEHLMSKGINTRRYFYPLISNFMMYEVFPSASKENLPIANNIAQEILCLPIYPNLPFEDVERICGLIKDVTCQL